MTATTLQDHLRIYNEADGIGTLDGCDLLHLERRPSHHYAANTYLTALAEINRLSRQVAQLEAQKEALAGMLDAIYADGKGVE